MAIDPYNIGLMGQCLQAELQSTWPHPLLGQVQNHGPEIEINIPIEGEEEYISWSKRINKLKYGQGRQLLYLPIREVYSPNSSDLFCDSSHQVVLVFKKYTDTLSDNLARNVKMGSHYREAQLWYLLDTLTKFVALFEKRETETRLTFQSVVIADDGELRIIPEIITPSIETHTIFFMKHTSSSADEPKPNPKIKSPVQAIGIMALALAALIPQQSLYNTLKRTWLDLPHLKQEKMLATCEELYSVLLTKTIREMISPNPRDRISLQELLKRLQPFQNQLNAEGASRVSFGNTSQSERQIFHGDFASLKNSRLNALSQAVKIDESSMHLDGSYAIRKEESVIEDFPSIL